jgi:hypothetical protein
MATNKKLSTKDFIDKAIIVHGNRYDYSLVNYVNSKMKVIIICPQHGQFLQEAASHLQGHNCSKCSSEITSKKNIKSLDQFIIDAKNIHGDRYDYSNSVYINDTEKLEIVCVEHGSFLQSPTLHLQGRGCYQCGRSKTNLCLKARIISLDEFIKRAHQIHGDNFTYDKVVYKNSNSRVIITCKIHGDFNQSPIKHLSGQGCKLCGFDILSKKYLKDCNVFVDQANLVHHNKYDYSESIYLGGECKVKIICPLHGMFKQIPNSHLSGRGCPKCGFNISHMEERWLDSLSIPSDYRNKVIKINNKRIKTDAYDPTTNTVYEFYGDFWHGNPKIYNQNDINKANKRAFGELFSKTLEREKLIKDAGYNLITIWEDDFESVNGN